MNEINLEMNKIELDSCDVAYNKKHNEVRMLINSMDDDARLVIFNSKENDLEVFLTRLSESEIHKISVMAQPMFPQSFSDVVEVGEETYDTYRLKNDDDLTPHYNGDQQMIELVIDTETRRFLSRMIWQENEVMNYILSL